MWSWLKIKCSAHVHGTEETWHPVPVWLITVVLIVFGHTGNPFNFIVGLLMGFVGNKKTTDYPTHPLNNLIQIHMHKVLTGAA